MMTLPDFVAKWRGHEFQSSTGLTEEFAAFAKEFKKAITQEMMDAFVVTFHGGHFEVSGFLQNKTTDRCVYWHISDVRFFSDEWVDHMLIRTTRDDHDYTGGPNQYASLVDLHDRAMLMTTL